MRRRLMSHETSGSLEKDGFRLLVFCEAGRVFLQSRNLRDLTGSVPRDRGRGTAIARTPAPLRDAPRQGPAAPRGPRADAFSGCEMEQVEYVLGP
jgi:hypothetical protein